MAQVIPKEDIENQLNEYKLHAAGQFLTARNPKEDLNKVNYDLGRIAAYNEILNWINQQ